MYKVVGPVYCMPTSPHISLFDFLFFSFYLIQDRYFPKFICLLTLLTHHQEKWRYYADYDMIQLFDTPNWATSFQFN